MSTKIHSRVSAANEDPGSELSSSSEEDRRYVLEGIFWVPLSNSSSDHTISRKISEPCSEDI